MSKSIHGIMSHQYHPKAIMFCAIAVAVLLHFLALFWASKVKIDYQYAGAALMEHQRVQQVDREGRISKKEENQRKVDQLAEVLNRIVQQPVEINALNYDVKEMQPDSFSTDLDKFDGKLLMDENLSQTADDDQLDGTSDMLEIFPAAEQIKGGDGAVSKFLRRPSPVEILFPNDENLADELIMATEMAQGFLEPSAAEEISTADLIKAGRSKKLL